MYNDIRVNGAVYRDTYLITTQHTESNYIVNVIFKSVFMSKNNVLFTYSFARAFGNFLESVSNTAVTSVVAAIYATCLRVALHFKLKDYIGDSWFGCAISTHTCDTVIPTEDIEVCAYTPSSSIDTIKSTDTPYSNVVIVPEQESAMLSEEPTVESGYVERQTCVNRGTPEGTQI